LCLGLDLGRGLCRDPGLSLGLGLGLGLGVCLDLVLAGTGVSFCFDFSRKNEGKTMKQILIHKRVVGSFCFATGYAYSWTYFFAEESQLYGGSRFSMSTEYNLINSNFFGLAKESSE
jgi:hypothetical protein